MSNINIGFIGLGIMGKHIANYLLKISDNFYIVNFFFLSLEFFLIRHVSYVDISHH